MDKSKIIGIVAAVIGAIVGSMVFQAMFHKDQQGISIDQQLVQTASTINKNLPMMVDRETRLDSTAAMPGNQLHYYYTIVNRNKTEMNAADLEKAMRPKTINNYKSSTDMKALRDNNVELHYRYKDKNGEEFLHFAIAPKDF